MGRSYKMKCVICGKEYPNQYGNNPYPVKKKGLCCDQCNDTIVIPARIKAYLESKAKEEER